MPPGQRELTHGGQQPHLEATGHRMGTINASDERGNGRHRRDGNGHLATGPPRWITRRTAALNARFWGLVAVHSGLLTIAYAMAFQLRFDLDVPVEYRQLFWQTLPFVLITKLLIFYAFGSFFGWWRYVTFSDLSTLLRASVTASITIAVVDHLFVSSLQIPRSVILMDCGSVILLVGGLRSFPRLYSEHFWRDRGGTGHDRAFMIGACEGGDLFAGQIHKHPRLDYRIIGYLDDKLGACRDAPRGNPVSRNDKRTCPSRPPVPRVRRIDHREQPHGTESASRDGIVSSGGDYHQDDPSGRRFAAQLQSSAGSGRQHQ